MSDKSGYLGNPNLKPVGIKIDFTEEQIVILHEKLDIVLNYHQKRSGLFNAVSP